MTPRITANPRPDAMEKLVKLVPIALVVLVVLGIAAYFVIPMMRGTAPPPPPTAMTPAEQAPAGAAPPTTVPAEPVVPPPPALLDIPVDQLIANARTALGEQRLVAPAGNNALEMYLAVLTKEPQNNTARDALMELTGFAREAAEREINTNNVEEAARMIALLERADPDSYTVQSLKKKLELKQGQLDRDKLQADSAQQAAQQASQQAAAERAAAEREAAAAAAGAVPPSTPGATSAPPTGTAATSAPTTTGPKPTGPAGSASTSPGATRPPTTPASTPADSAPATPAAAGPNVDAQVVQQFPPEYPAQAVRKRVEGWVEIEFTVGTNGKVKDAAVLRAQPQRVFDREALRAIERWTFKPRMEGGKAVESRLKRRMEFKLNS